MAGSFRELELLPIYSTQKNDLVNDFYVPVISRAVNYDRVSGFFSSSSLSVVARGLSKFLKNKDARMRMLVSCKGFSESDKIDEVYGIEEQVIKEFERILSEDIEKLENEIVRKRVQALAWLLKTGRLEIKVAVMTPLEFQRGMLHSKFGTLTDAEGNTVSFIGSINESANGWKVNGEVISVFSSLEQGQDAYINNLADEFEAYWRNEVERNLVIDLPSAISAKLVSYAPKNIDDVIGSIDPEKSVKSVKTLRYYQIEALNAWLDGGKRGYFEMATGTGKTLTAIRCIKEALSEDPSLGVVIAVPTKVLVEQWRDDLIEDGFDKSQIYLCNSDYKKSDWYNSLVRYSLIDSEENRVFIFSYSSLYKDKIQELFDSSKRKFMLICDEMHHAGATQFSNCLNENIELRLGLSATPIRAHDIEGSKLLLDYFGSEPLMLFDIGRALTEENPDTELSYLSPYYYHFRTVHLTDTEHEKFMKLSRRIAAKLSSSDIDENDAGHPDKLRALLISCASDKVRFLGGLIDELKEKGMNKKILFYSQSYDSGDLGEKQIESVKKILHSKNLNFQEYTSRFDDPEFRRNILDNFRNDRIDAIVAIKCLDEGINIPEVRTAVIMASSSNSAEFIQRRGRVLRRSPGKDHAVLYDFLVGPPLSTKLKDSDQTLLRRELSRAIEYSRHSLNRDENDKLIDEWLRTYNLTRGDLIG